MEVDVMCDWLRKGIARGKKIFMSDVWTPNFVLKTGTDKNSNSGLASRVQFFRQSIFFASSLVLHHFFLSMDFDTAPRTTRPLYNFLKQQAQGNSLRLTILSIFVYYGCRSPFASLRLFFLGDRMGCQRI
jgi:hypothetical protein